MINLIYIAYYLLHVPITIIPLYIIWGIQVVRKTDKDKKAVLKRLREEAKAKVTAGSAKDLEHVKKISVKLGTFEGAVDKTPKAAFETLLNTLDAVGLKNVREYLKKRNNGGKTDAKLAGVARLLFGADMDKVEETMQECGAVLTSIETAVQYGYECFVEAEETDIGGLKELIEKVMWEKMDKEMKDWGDDSPIA